ncbi:MAG: hypothetical protein QJR03_14500 [Sphaerobacter sp.]|nr:hypothetical protein [Sphaerobacter sp.]
MAVERGQGSLVSAVVWMILLSILLFWLPAIGPLIAEIVAGRKAGDIGTALLAAIIPAILAGLLLFILGTAFALPAVGAIAGAGVLVVLVVNSVPLLVGALIGGALGS